MHPNTQRSLVILTGIIACIPLFFLNIHNYHNWGDDYSQYISEARNIVHNKPYYKSGYVFNQFNTYYAPAQYPVGFPLMLAPLVRLFGIAIKPMLYLNACLLTCFFFVVLFYFRRYTSYTTAFCMALLAIYGGFMLDFKQMVLSDLPCAVLISAYFLVRRSGALSRARIIILILLACMAMLVRTQAILLVVAEAIFAAIPICRRLLAHEKPNWKSTYSSMAIGGGTVIAYFIITHFVFYAPSSTLAYYTNMTDHSGKKMVTVLSENFNYFLDLLGSLFYYPESSTAWPVVAIAMRASVVCTLVGYVMVSIKRIAIEDIFFTLVFLMLVILPVQQGARLILPVLPIILYYCYSSMKLMLVNGIGVKGKTAAIVLTALYFIAGLRSFKATLHSENTAGTPYDGSAQSAFSYIKHNINDSDIIVFAKPRALTLYTGKKSMVQAYSSVEDNKKIFTDMRAKYILIANGLDAAWYYDYLAQTRSAIDSARINNDYILYRIR